jgi:hypothetical protein
MSDYFRNRTVVLATMHRKEQAIAPILETALGVRVIVAATLNTDEFGTFTRDRERPASQLETARLKAQKALELSGETLAIASEGSFVPHPSFPAVACDRELVVLLDQANELELVGEEVSLNTNYRHTTVKSAIAAQQFAETVGFPAHGLIAMTSASATSPTEIVKGIITTEQLEQAVGQLLQRSPTGSIHLETDMRALYNPTRMDVIAKATQNLVTLTQSTCPKCATPGFAICDRRPGLPCALCGLPTPLTHSVLYRCLKCPYSQDVLFPEGNTTADPTYCHYCNP